jgi:hypothetical protein
MMLVASTLKAQITTYISPPRAQLPNPQTVAVADSVRKDSVQQATMTNMKAWVDSAAGVSVPSRVGQVDSAALANDPGRPDPIDRRDQPVVTTFSNGSVAPATASDLPELAIIGLVVLMLGAVLLVKRPHA